MVSCTELAESCNYYELLLLKVWNHKTVLFKKKGKGQFQLCCWAGDVCSMGYASSLGWFFGEVPYLNGGLSSSQKLCNFVVSSRQTLRVETDVVPCCHKHF